MTKLTPELRDIAVANGWIKYPEKPERLSELETQRILRRAIVDRHLAKKGKR